MKTSTMIFIIIALLIVACKKEVDPKTVYTPRYDLLEEAEEELFEEDAFEDLPELDSGGPAGHEHDDD